MMDAINTAEILQIIDELWFHHRFDQILSYIQLPISILEIIVLFKINQVLKIYIKDNEKYL